MIPELRQKPNFLFRFIRFLFHGGYKEGVIAQKIVNFLDTNKIYLLNKSDIEPLKNLFLRKISNPKQKDRLIKQFDRVIQQINDVMKQNPIFEKATQPVQPKIIDVPDDGSCLLYAIAVGLRKQYADYPDIQSRLRWAINPDQLNQLSAASLEIPGK